MMKELLSKFIPHFISKQFVDSPNRQKIAANSGWLFADKIARMVVGLAVGVWVARYLGPSRFGLLSYAVAFGSLFGALASLGIDGIAIRELVKGSRDTDSILGTTFTLQLIAGAGSWGLVALAAYLFPLQESSVFWLILIISSGFFFQAFGTIEYYFRARVESRYIVLAKILPFGVTSAVKIGLILMQAPLMAFAAVIAAELLLNALGLFVVYRISGGRFVKWRFSLVKGKELLSESWPMMVAALSIMVYMRIDQVMLGYMGDSNMVGIYSAAVRVSELWYFIPMFFAQSAFPAVVQSREADDVLYHRRLQNMFSLMIVTSYLIALPLTLMSPWIIDLLYGSAFSPAAAVVSVHVWAGVFVSMGVVQSSWIISEGLTKLSLYKALLGAVSNIILNLLLIPSMGIMGAAVATVVSYAIAACFSNLLFPSTRNIFRMQMKGLRCGFERTV